MSRGLRQEVKDFIGAPFRLTVLPDDVSTRLGLTSMETERVEMVLRHARGRLLDVGCGRNVLARRYGLDRAVGVDVYDFGGGARLIEDAARLPFPDASFDTVTFLACLNHIPARMAALHEARRVLRDDGQVLATMIDPVLGWIGHTFLWWHDADRHDRGMASGERYGLWPGDLIAAATQAGLALERRRRFVYGLNQLFVFRPR